MKRSIFVLLISLAFAGYTNAQNEVDALRYSQFYLNGTARSAAMGGAFGSLGADFTSLSINPAGIGLYKASEFTITPSVFTGKANSTYMGVASEDLKYNFNLGNLGLVLAFTPKGSSGWKGVQFGMGVNRLNNFNNRIVMEGYNAKNSLLDDYYNKAVGNAPADLDAFDTKLAFDLYLLDTLGGLTDYISAVPHGQTQQSKYIDRNGSINEMVLCLGGNYNDKLYIGGSLGFPFVRYFENSTYTEKDIHDSIPKFKQFSVKDDLETTGSGFNFKFGLIYRITDWVRFGASVHTPTFYTMHDTYSRTMDAEFDTGKKEPSDSPKGKFDYELTTPLRANASLSFIISKFALISADYEFVDYSSARLRSGTYKFYDENKAIDVKYTAQSNIRAGLEFRLAPVSLRVGGAYSTSPYRSSLNDGSRISYSGGIGFREKGYFIDLAYVYSKSGEDYYLYPSVPEASKVNYSNHNIMLTLGVKFGGKN
ncbi:MAG: hypothetical protein WCM76_13895 [Bacteroidota bacterium]